METPLDTLTNSQLIRISPITINSTSSISALVVAVLVVASTIGVTGGCDWEDRPVKNSAGTSGAGNGVGDVVSPTAGTSTSSGRNPAIPPGTPSFQFNKIDYVLVSNSDVVNQYIPFGQTLDNWTSMFALRKFPNMTSPDEAVKNVTQTLEIEHPETMFKVTPDEATGDRGVDFVIWTEDKQLSEFDVHIYQQRDGGVLGKMFLMRDYGEDGHYRLLKTVADKKNSLTKQVFSFRFPKFIQPQ